MPGGSKEGGGLKVKSQYKSPVGYTPFKMKGHTLPGIKQRSPNTAKTFGVDSSESPKKVATSPGKFLGGLLGGGSAGFKRIMDKIRATKEAKSAQEVAPEEEAEGTMMDQEMAGAEGGGGAVPQHGPESHTGGGMRVKKPFNFKPPNLGNFFSDARLKEKIEKTGVSPSGIPIYEFNYIGSNNRYSGAMAQDLLEINPDAVTMDTSGYYKVNYNDIDVDMHLIN